uniref:hypothetical protein n=1 Tax=Shewanella gaetbuli TaxID=220752 RepID=UPI003B5A72CF
MNKQIVIGASLIFCSINLMAEQINSSSIRAESTENERIYSGEYSSPFWQSEEFKGTHKRVLEGSRLEFQLNEITGGVDTAVAGADRPGLNVSQVAENLSVCMKTQVESEGHWWAGPKVSVNWQSMVDKDNTTWYENYIIDNASMNPIEIEDWIYKIHKGKYLGKTAQDGSEYKHYIIHFKTWVQYWSVRQSYRNVGVTSIKPILDIWRSHGMENLEFDGVKLNIEFHGPAQAKVVIDGYIPSSYKKVIDTSFEKDCIKG